MKPESLLGISLELIERVAVPGAYPSDARVGRFFRKRRFLGSRDRRFLSEAVYSWLRHGLRARARWRRWARDIEHSLPTDERVLELEKDLALGGAEDDAGSPPPSDEGGERETAGGASLAEKRSDLRRIYLLDILALAREGFFPSSFAETAEAARVRAEALAEIPWGNVEERATRDDFLDATPLPEDPVERLAVESSLPRWLAVRLVEERGEGMARSLAKALLAPASLDLRVNLRLRDRLEVRAELERETGQSVEVTPHSPAGLRIAGRVNLTATKASRKSWIEVQDEGSQIAALAGDPAPGMVVIDACAGSGGKTLAIADAIFERQPRGTGRIFAADIARRRLAELERRARDAGLAGRVSIAPVYPAGPLPERLPEADLVLIDAPCTGLGTLRRNPELKRRFGPGDVTGFAELQLSLLERFAPLVKAGGRLVYVTCSFLREECEDVALAFEERHPEFEPYLGQGIAARLPEASRSGHRIRLDPLLTATDAFFIATWSRSAPAPGRADR